MPKDITIKGYESGTVRLFDLVRNKGVTDRTQLNIKWSTFSTVWRI